MFERIAVFAKNALTLIETHSFCTGFCAGLIAFLVVLLVLFHLRAKRVSALSFRTDRGTVTVSSEAVAGLVESLNGDFPELKFRRERLMRKHGSVYLEIVADDLGRRDAALPAAARRLQTLALETIRTHFGLENISCVALRIHSSRPPEQYGPLCEPEKPAAAEPETGKKV